MSKDVRNAASVSRSFPPMVEGGLRGLAELPVLNVLFVYAGDFGATTPR